MQEQCYGCIIFDQDMVFMLQQNNGGWDFPAGQVKSIESAEEFVKREILEQTGMEIEITGQKRYDTFSNASFKKYFLMARVVKRDQLFLDLGAFKWVFRKDVLQQLNNPDTKAIWQQLLVDYPPRRTCLTEENKDMAPEKSCGCIVVKDEKVLLVHSNEGHWLFPKGHVEVGETEQETAKREVLEETGIEVEVVGDKKYHIYYIQFSGVPKDVYFFLARPLAGDLKPQRSEVIAAEWVSYEEVSSYLSENVQEMWRQVQQDLSNNIC